MVNVAHGRILMFLAVVLPALAGCATSGTIAVAAPDSRIESMSAQWSQTAAGVDVGTAQDLSRWWEQLGDPTLTDLIDRTLDGSPDVRTAQARLRQALAQRDIARAELLPSVNASASAAQRSTSSGADHTSTSVSAGVDASWDPDVFGATRSAVDAAMADLQASSADLHATQVSLAGEVARTFAELRVFQARLDIARRNEVTQAETLELTTLRAQAGLVSSIAVEQARANLEQTRAQLPSLESGITQAIHRLSTLAGLEPSALTAALGAAADLPVVPEAVTIGIPSDTLRQRPDVRAAEQRVLAETARLDQAEAQRYPRFSLSGSVGSEVLAGALSGGTSLVSSVVGSLFQTIFDGGRIGRQIEIQGAVQEQAIVSYEATVLAALEDVENALVSLEASRQRLTSLETAAEAAGNAALLARSEYAVGLTDFQTVLDTERTVLAVEDGLATARGDRWVALVQLYTALGGGWSPGAADALTIGMDRS